MNTTLYVLMVLCTPQQCDMSRAPASAIYQNMVECDKARFRYEQEASRAFLGGNKLPLNYVQYMKCQKAKP